jgi:hypothetical protein
MNSFNRFNEMDVGLVRRKGGGAPMYKKLFQQNLKYYNTISFRATSSVQRTFVGTCTMYIHNNVAHWLSLGRVHNKNVNQLPF